jgi:hypothetical protein
MKLYRLMWNGDFPAKRITEDLDKHPELRRGLTMRLETVGTRSFHAMYLVPQRGYESQLERAARNWEPDSQGWIEPDPAIFRISEQEEEAGQPSILHLVSSEVVIGPALA